MVQVATMVAVVVVVLPVVAWAVVQVLRRQVEDRLGATDAELRRLSDVGVLRERGTDEVRREIAAFRGSLEDMRVREEERRAREEQGWTTLHRVAAVLVGGQKTGRTGENVLREALSQLPPSMVVFDFRVNGKVVEFGLVLPDGRRLPIDSKWPADRELQALSASTDPEERERLIRAIERTVAERAREVSGYRDPAVTAPVGVAAVPDAAYAVLRRAHAEAYRYGVIVIPYSMALPVVLFLYSIVSRFGAVGDVETCLADLATALDAMEGTLENKLTRASVMLSNGAEELRGHVGRARGSLARARQAESLLEEGGDEDGLPRLVGVPP
jgi:DNA recombination protein RmuC